MMIAEPFSHAATYTLAPCLFILMGNIVAVSGIAEDMTVARNWIGHVRGGLAMARQLPAAVLLP